MCVHGLINIIMYKFSSYKDFTLIKSYKLNAFISIIVPDPLSLNMQKRVHFTHCRQVTFAHVVAIDRSHTGLPV